MFYQEIVGNTLVTKTNKNIDFTGMNTYQEHKKSLILEDY